MRLALMTMAFALLPALAAAQPPAAGSTHTFYDPLFQGTVFCDTIEPIREIATAEEPVAVYESYMQTLNARNEPRCAALVPTAEVLSVVPIGVMVRDGEHFRAWAVEARVGDLTAYALYLEHFELVTA